MFAPTELRGLPTSTTPAQALRTRKPARSVQPIERLENRQLMSASVAGVVYNDLNVANTLKPGDPMIAGVRVYADIGNHNAYKVGDPTAITDAQGAYKIGNLAPGSYVLREVVPAHFRQTEPTNGAGQDIVIASDYTHLYNVDFGDTQKVRVSGTVFNDSNGDSLQNHGESIVTNVTVFIDTNGNKKLDAGELHTTTNSAGYWVIGDLPAGKTYTVRVVDPTGFVQTNPTGNGAHVVTLQNGQTADNLLFGIRPATVVINSQTRTAEADAGDLSQPNTSNNVGVFDTTATVFDQAFGDGATSNLTSSITANKITALGSMSYVNQNNTGGAQASVDVTFTLSAATAYSTGYDIFGNNFAFQLKNLGTNSFVINNMPSNNPGVANYAFSKSGTLAAGKYELSFNVYDFSTNPLKTSGYVMNFNI